MGVASFGELDTDMTSRGFGTEAPGTLMGSGPASRASGVAPPELGIRALGTLPRRETELVNPRVAHPRTCTDEWEHHRHRGRRAGIGAADIDRVVAGPEAPGWIAREALELVLFAAHYEMLATFIATLRIAPEERRVRRWRRG